MLPEAALHFKEVTVHPPRCMPLSAHSLCSKKEPALSYACLSCSRVWVGAFSWLTVTGALLVPSRALSDASSGLLRSVFFWCLLGQFYLWPPVSHASLLVSELSLSERLGGCQRKTGSVLFFLVPDADAAPPSSHRPFFQKKRIFRLYTVLELWDDSRWASGSHRACKLHCCFLCFQVQRHFFG